MNQRKRKKVVMQRCRERGWAVAIEALLRRPVKHLRIIMQPAPPPRETLHGMPVLFMDENTTQAEFNDFMKGIQ